MSKNTIILSAKHDFTIKELLNEIDDLYDLLQEIDTRTLIKELRERCMVSELLEYIEVDELIAELKRCDAEHEFIKKVPEYMLIDELKERELFEKEVDELLKDGKVIHTSDIPKYMQNLLSYELHDLMCDILGISRTSTIDHICNKLILNL